MRSYTLTGTIMSNRRGLPEQFKGKHKMDIGSTEVTDVEICLEG